MIRLAKNSEIGTIATMLRYMYRELWGEEASNDLDIYTKVVKGHIDNPKEYVYVDDKYRGFFIVRDETEIMTPNLHRFNGIRVFIHPDYRKSPLLRLFYTHLFHEFPDGDILGMTEINSEHIAVLDKRHELIAKVYKLNRSR